MINRRRISSLR